MLELVFFFFFFDFDTDGPTTFLELLVDYEMTPLIRGPLGSRQ